MLINCSNPKPVSINPLKEAWEHGDRNFFFHYLDSIQTLKPNDFVWAMHKLNSPAEFRYGILDPEIDWSKENADTMNQIKSHIVIVNKIFYKHCDFSISNERYDSLSYLQDKYFKYYSLPDSIYREIELEIKAYCDNIK